MKQETEKTFLYEPPEVEVTEVCVEHGYEASRSTINTPTWGTNEGEWQ